MQQPTYQTFSAVPLTPSGCLSAFLDRLERENGWSAELTEEVVEEYRRYLFLVLSGEGPVTPSDMVDQVWHCHIQDTQGYRAYCEAAFGKFVDHVPSRGGPAESALMRRQYARSLALYSKVFGAPAPVHIWPSPPDRFGRDLRFERVNRTDHWLIRKPHLGWRIGWLSLILGANLLTLREHGALFLACNLCLFVSAFLAKDWFLSRRRLPRTTVALSHYEAAELSSLGRSLDLAFVELLRGQHLELKDDRVLRGKAQSDPQSELGRRLYKLVPAEGTYLRSLEGAARPLSTSINQELKQKGLVAPGFRQVHALLWLAPGLAFARAVSELYGPAASFAWFLPGLTELWLVYRFRTTLQRTLVGEAVYQELLAEHSCSEEPVQEPMRLAMTGIAGLSSSPQGLVQWLELRPRPEVVARNKGGCAGGGCGSGCGCG